VRDADSAGRRFPSLSVVVEDPSLNSSSGTDDDVVLIRPVLIGRPRGASFGRKPLRPSLNRIARVF